MNLAKQHIRQQYYFQMLLMFPDLGKSKWKCHITKRNRRCDGYTSYEHVDVKNDIYFVLSLINTEDHEHINIKFYDDKITYNIDMKHMKDVDLLEGLMRTFMNKYVGDNPIKREIRDTYAESKQE